MTAIRRSVFAAQVLLWLLSGNVFAQGCASCYTTAAAGGPETAHALKSGIMLLLFPPTLIFAGIILVVRSWKSSNPTASSASDKLHERGDSETREEETT